MADVILSGPVVPAEQDKPKPINERNLAGLLYVPDGIAVLPGTVAIGVKRKASLREDEALADKLAALEREDTQRAFDAVVKALFFAGVAGKPDRLLIIGIARSLKKWARTLAGR